jgi:hypothetical protein
LGKIGENRGLEAVPITSFLKETADKIVKNCEGIDKVWRFGNNYDKINKK